VNTKLEKMAATLEASDDYRVLRRLNDADIVAQEADGPTYRGIYLDVEAEGLDTERDNITELAMLEFEFAKDGTFMGLLNGLHFYNDPGRPLKPEITKITGITDDMVAGQSIDRMAVVGMVQRCQLVIAHNASYDRQLLEADTGATVISVKWCATTGVPMAIRSLHEADRPRPGNARLARRTGASRS